MDFRPQRRSVLVASLALPFAAITALCWQFAGESQITKILGGVTLVVGGLGVTMLMRDFDRWQKGAITASRPYQAVSARARIIGLWGAAIIMGSFAFLASSVLWADPLSSFVFPTWLVLFLIGAAMAWFPVITKWAITLGLLRREDR
jgi:hypothetical protein